MEVYTTVTQKGQVTIPVAFRKKIGIRPYSRVKVSVSEKSVRLEPAFDIFDIAPLSRAPKSMNALKARELMQKKYTGRI